MKVNESESNGTGSNESSSSEGDVIINEELSGANNSLLEANSVAVDPALPSKRDGPSRSSSSFSSNESLIEVVSGNDSGSQSVSLEHSTLSDLKEEHKDEIPDYATELPSPDVTDAALSTSTMDIPTIQTMERNEHYNPDRIPQSVFASSETLTPREWSDTSNESLFSIHPKTSSYGGDQAFLLAVDEHKEKETQKSEDFTKSDDPSSNPPQASIEPTEYKNIGKERKREEREASQSKTKQPNEKPNPLGQDEAKPPNSIVIALNPSPRSDGSDGSDYSFAFPILVPNGKQSSSTKADALSSRRRPSKGYHHEAESSITRQRPSSPPKKTISCDCFSCHYPCFSCCSIDSCCTRTSCLSCCIHPSCQSCCNQQSCCSCCSQQSCFSCLKQQSCFSCCKQRSCFSCCKLPSCHSCCKCLSCTSWRKSSCFSCWPCR